MGKKNDNTLVKNASFLMIAALISKDVYKRQDLGTDQRGQHQVSVLAGK